MSKYFIPEEDIEEIIQNLWLVRSGTNPNLEFGGKTILTLGCYGFLGKMMLSYLFYLNDTYLQHNPCYIIGMDNFIVGKVPEKINRSDFQFIQHNICEPLWMKIPAKQKIDYIINFAGIADPKAYVAQKCLTFDIGTVGTTNVLQYALYKECKSALFFSSSEVYGNPDEANIPTTEEYNGNLPAMGKRACYDESKRAILTLTDIYHSDYDVPTKVILPFNVVSCGMSINDGRVIPTYIRNILDGKKMPVYGKGGETRTFCYGTDFLSGVVLALLYGEAGGFWNLGNSNNEISMLDLAILVESVTGSKDAIEFIPYSPVYAKQPQRRCPSIDKAERELGYFPRVDLISIIERYWKWAKENYQF